MKRIIIGLIILIVSNSVVNAKMSSFLLKLERTNDSKIGNIVKKLPSKTTSILTHANKNINIPKLKLSPLIQKHPQKLLLATKAQAIVSKGKFEKKFFENQSFSNQLSTIVQSSKYGNEYFDIAKKVSSISYDKFKNISKLSKVIPSFKFDKIKLQTKFIDTLNKTGEIGMNTLKSISSFIYENPKKSGAIGAYIWYVMDPISFTQELKDSTKTLSQFIGTIAVGVVSGAGESVTEKIDTIISDAKEDIKNNIVNNFNLSKSSIINNIFGILIFIGLFVIWRKRLIIKEFLLRADRVKKKENKSSNDIEEIKADDEF